MKILVLNAGSSSQKSRLYELASAPHDLIPTGNALRATAAPSAGRSSSIQPALPDLAPTPLWEAEADWGEHEGKAEVQIKTAHGAVLNEELNTSLRPEVIGHLLTTLWSGTTQVIAGPKAIDVVGHRVVHGGEEYRESTLITPEVKAAISRLAVFAPAHNPANLEGIEVIERMLPHVPQVAVFDTAFHRKLPPAAVVYPGPYEWFEQGIQRYGFHGISHEYCAHRAAQILGKDLRSLRMITCHLGNGCSLAAIQDGHSIDTTMGFTPLEGVMMGSRSGTVDPGILIHLLRQKGATADQLDATLNKASGLKGVSGISSDMREILSGMARGNARAQLAFDVYVHRLRSFIGAMLASLGRLDALVFAGGVGENAARVRAAACEAFRFLGLSLDEEKNAGSPADTDVATADSSVRVLIVHTQEDWQIAKECWRLYPFGPSSNDSGDD